MCYGFMQLASVCLLYNKEISQCETKAPITPFITGVDLLALPFVAFQAPAILVAIVLCHVQ